MSEYLIVSTLKGNRGKRPPIWMMRQAGRSLPEYRELRSKHSMLKVITTPELACEVTLQPIRRFHPDAAIIFADILNPLIGLGLDLEFVKGRGPVFNNPLQTPADIAALNGDVLPEDTVGYTLETLKLVNQELEKYRIPVLGFAGAPFTLSYYAVEGHYVKNPIKLKKLMADKQNWNKLQELLVNFTVKYLEAQVKSGAAAVQVFDSWFGSLTEYQFSEMVKPWLIKLFSELKRRVDVPIIYFPMNSFSMTSEVSKLGANVLSVDWRQSLSKVESAMSDEIKALQGNLDPLLLCGDARLLEEEIKLLLKESSSLACGHVMNLGHGIIPEAKIDNIKLFVDTIKSYSY